MPMEGQAPASPMKESLRSLCHFSPRNLYVGVDVGRTQDLTVITVLEKGRDLCFVRAMLRLRGMRLPEQQALLEEACRSPRFAGAQIDMTGLGLGLYEYTQKIFGDRIRGLNFASSLPVQPGPHSTFGIRHSPIASARAPEVLALRLLQIYEARRLRHPVDPLLREDLRQPERVTTAEGRVSIVAGRGGGSGGHADHFWSLALAVDCAQRQPESYVHVISGIRPRPIPRKRLIV